MRTRLIGFLVLFAALASSCSSGPSVTVVDGVEITTEDVSVLHNDFDRLDDDERAGSLLLLILREAFGTAAADELGLTVDESAVYAAESERIEAFESRGGADVVLGSTNQTRARVRVESELDVIRQTVERALVQNESSGFDLDRAYESFLLAESEVCLRLMAFNSQPDFDAALDRLEAGEDFALVAREVSVDPFAQRDEGSGAGGDFGCSTPDALIVEFGSEALNAELNVPTGPVLVGPSLYLFEIYERTTPDLEDVREDVIELAVTEQGPDLFRAWAIDVLQTIEVEVASEFGVWGTLPETDPVPTVVPSYRTDSIIDS